MEENQEIEQEIAQQEEQTSSQGNVRYTQIYDIQLKKYPARTMTYNNARFKRAMNSVLRTANIDWSKGFEENFKEINKVYGNKLNDTELHNPQIKDLYIEAMTEFYDVKNTMYANNFLFNDIVSSILGDGSNFALGHDISVGNLDNYTEGKEITDLAWGSLNSYDIKYNKEHGTDGKQYVIIQIPDADHSASFNAKYNNPDINSYANKYRNKDIRIYKGSDLENLNIDDECGAWFNGFIDYIGTQEYRVHSDMPFVNRTKKITKEDFSNPDNTYIIIPRSSANLIPLVEAMIWDSYNHDYTAKGRGRFVGKDEEFYDNAPDSGRFFDPNVFYPQFKYDDTVSIIGKDLEAFDNFKIDRYLLDGGTIEDRGKVTQQYLKEYYDGLKQVYPSTNSNTGVGSINPTPEYKDFKAFLLASGFTDDQALKQLKLYTNDIITAFTRGDLDIQDYDIKLMSGDNMELKTINPIDVNSLSAALRSKNTALIKDGIPEYKLELGWTFRLGDPMSNPLKFSIGVPGQIINEFFYRDKVEEYNNNNKLEGDKRYDYTKEQDLNELYQRINNPDIFPKPYMQNGMYYVEIPIDALPQANNNWQNLSEYLNSEKLQIANEIQSMADTPYSVKSLCNNSVFGSVSLSSTEDPRIFKLKIENGDGKPSYEFNVENDVELANLIKCFRDFDTSYNMAQPTGRQEFTDEEIQAFQGTFVKDYIAIQNALKNVHSYVNFGDDNARTLSAPTVDSSQISYTINNRINKNSFEPIIVEGDNVEFGIVIFPNSNYAMNKVEYQRIANENENRMLFPKSLLESNGYGSSTINNFPTFNTVFPNATKYMSTFQYFGGVSWEDMFNQYVGDVESEYDQWHPNNSEENQ